LKSLIFGEEAGKQQKMTTIIEFIILFVTAFGFNLIPFAGPSNLLIASDFALLLVSPDITTLLIIGLLVAFAAALSKGIHYMITFFVSGRLSEKRRARLDADGAKVKRWASLLLFLVAATPIPDEPVVIPLGLMKYSPAKFFLSYFLGKLSITVAGAFLGSFTGSLFSEWLSPELMVIISIILTVVITVVLLKIDLGKLAEKVLHRKPAEKTKESQEKLNKTGQEPNSES
jgi:membrane protein DedA with SNARE-associated domain